MATQKISVGQKMAGKNPKKGEEKMTQRKIKIIWATGGQRGGTSHHSQNCTCCVCKGIRRRQRRKPLKLNSELENELRRLKIPLGYQ